MRVAKAVLVTGASSGIGRKVTERLAAAGHFVYAGARKARDLQALAALNNVQPLRLDVMNREDVARAVNAVRDGGRGLFGLVNNAGVVTLGPVLDGDESEFDLVMRVNVYGAYRVTRAFAPLIVAERGRIVMISSVAGILANRNVSAYSMSKHAIEAFTDCLAAELQAHGVCVSVVEPGTFHTEIGRSAVRRAGDNPLLPDFSKFPPPDAVAEAIDGALFEPRPRRRYLVVPHEDEAESTIRKLIEQLVQLNQGHDFTYDRAALVGMLDEALGCSHAPGASSSERQRLAPETCRSR